MMMLVLICSFGEAPSLTQAEEFRRVCSHFFEQHDGEIVGESVQLASVSWFTSIPIGVHCTHGYNRTGFLIISYLVEVEDWR